MSLFFCLCSYAAQQETQSQTLRARVIEQVAKDTNNYNLDELPICLKDEIAGIRLQYELEQKMLSMRKEVSFLEIHKKAPHILELLAKGARLEKLNEEVKNYEIAILLFQLIETKRLNYHQKIDALNACMHIKKDLKDRTNAHLLAHAIFHDQKLIPALLYFGIDATEPVTCIDHHPAQTSLHIAVRVGAINAVRMLLAHGVDPNILNFSASTPLHYASVLDKYEIAKLLISYGAAVDVQDSQGRTPLILAQSYPHMCALLQEPHKVLVKRTDSSSACQIEERPKKRSRE
jgi:hypothetical protein